MGFLTHERRRVQANKNLLEAALAVIAAYDTAVAKAIPQSETAFLESLMLLGETILKLRAAVEKLQR